MTSLVTDVLLGSGKLEKKDITTQIATMYTNSYKTKKTVFELIHKKYNSFGSDVKSCEDVLKELTETQKEVKEIESALTGKVVKQLKDSTHDFERLSEEHAQTVELLNVLEKLCKLDKSLDCYKNSMQSAMYVEAAEALNEAEEVLHSIDKETTFENMKIFKLLYESHTLNKQELLYTVDQVWKDCATWVVPKDGDDAVTGVSLSLCNLSLAKSKKDKIDNNKSVVLENCIKVLYKLESLDAKLIKLGELVIQCILQLIVTVPKLQVSLQPIKDKTKLTLEYGSEEATPIEIFKKVSTVLRFLFQNLLKFHVDDEKDGLTAMALFSEFTREKIMNLLLDKCLSATVPKTKEELSNYQQVASAVDKFETSLCEIDFLPKKANGSEYYSLSNYAADINAHFANQQCKDILAKARTLMLNEIKNTIEVSDEDKKIQVPKITKQSKSKTATEVVRPVGTKFTGNQAMKTLSDKTLKLPKCAVSVCAKEIIQLSYDTLCECATAGTIRGMQLLRTVHNIFELFATIVPVYHKEQLSSIPRLSAIHYNDCMYIAHHLLTMGHQFSTSPLVNNSMFVDKVPMFRQLGAECFLNQMKHQRSQMLECMEPLIRFSDNVSSDKNSDAQRAIKQVMYQMNHLRKIWNGILPHEVLKKSLGTLVNSCIKELVDSICKMEDISEDDSVALKLISQLLSDQVTMLFVFDEKVQDLSWQNYIPKWNRLQELINFLNCSLSAIVDRWADGKGPLAAVFTITEVKSLIRALFRNTDYRANALMKIRI